MMFRRFSCLLFIFSISVSSIEAQIVKEHFNKRLVYNEGEDELKFNTSKFSLVVNEGEMMLARTAEFHFMWEKQNYRVSGYLYDEKYFTYNGHTTFSVSSDWKKFRKIENETFNLDQFKDLTKYVSEENGTELNVYTQNLKDGIDYSKAMNFLTTKYGYNTPYLEKGEIVVYADFVFKNGENLLLNVLQSIDDIDENFFYDPDEISYAVTHDHVKASVAKIEPKYCGEFQEGVELPKVDDMVSDFNVTLCTYYNYWGYKNNPELLNYYSSEMTRTLKLIKERSLLTEKQTEEFRKKLEANRDDNLEKNFVKKKPYP